MLVDALEETEDHHAAVAAAATAVDVVVARLITAAGIARSLLLFMRPHCTLDT